MEYVCVATLLPVSRQIIASIMAMLLPEARLATCLYPLA